jgi:hypothetical protein
MNSVKWLCKVLGAALIMALLIGAVSGCAAMPDAILAETEHVSHPFAGWPVSPADTEACLSQVSVLGEWNRGRAYMVQGLGYKLGDCPSFYGPKVTYTFRVGYRFPIQRRD